MNTNSELITISQKECDETNYWPELLNETGYFDNMTFKEMNSTATEILKMLKSSILTFKGQLQKSNFIQIKP